MEREIVSVFIRRFWKPKIKRYLINRPHSIGEIIEAGLTLFFALDEKQKKQALRESSAGAQRPGTTEKTAEGESSA